MKWCSPRVFLQSGNISPVGRDRGEANFIACAMAETKILRLRTTRVQIAIPVFIYGNNESGPPFREISETASVNANGCLVALAAPVVKEQPLLLTNIKTNEDMQCNVVTLGNFVNGKTEVGLRFAAALAALLGYSDSRRKIGTPPSESATCPQNAEKCCGLRTRRRFSILLPARALPEESKHISHPVAFAGARMSQWVHESAGARYPAERNCRTAC